MMKHYSFCTVLDQKFIHYGYCLVKSLLKQNIDFKLYILALDEITKEFFENHFPQNTEVVTEKDINSQKLTDVKNNRSLRAFCWSCKPFLMNYILEKKNAESVCYLDSDLYFFQSPEILYQELEGFSILLTDHNFAKEYDQSALAGRFCAQLVLVKNDKTAKKAITWWGDQCIKWCYDKREDGKQGDQTYLESFEELFGSVVVSKSIGAGVAPWNTIRFQWKQVNNKIILTDKEGNLPEGPLLFFHFHEFKAMGGKYFHLGGYKLDPLALEVVYSEYMNGMRSLLSLLPNDNKQIISQFKTSTYSMVAKEIMKNILGRPRNILRL